VRASVLAEPGQSFTTLTYLQAVSEALFFAGMLCSLPHSMSVFLSLTLFVFACRGRPV
jgi:hypothetical protein